MVSDYQHSQIRLAAKALEEGRNPSKHRITTVDGEVVSGYIKCIHKSDDDNEVSIIDLLDDDTAQLRSFTSDQIRNIEKLKGPRDYASGE